MGVSSTALPTRLARHLGPSAPAPGTELGFIPWGLRSVAGPRAWLYGAAGVGALSAAGLIADLVRGHRDLRVALLVIALSLLTGALAWPRLRRARADRRALAAGRWRRGLHVLPTGLLRHDGERCWWIPRARARQLLIIERAYQGEGAMRGPMDVYLVFQADSGELERLYLPMIRSPVPARRGVDVVAHARLSTAPHVRDSTLMKLDRWILSGTAPTRTPNAEPTIGTDSPPKGGSRRGRFAKLG